MDKIIGKTLAEMVVPEDELWHIYGALPHAYDVWHHTCAEFSDNPAIFAGIGTGKRSDAVQASLFDMIHAEIMGEHNAEKARVRNRRKADRKHKVLPEERKHREEMRKDRMFGYYYNENCPKVMFAPDSLPIKYRKDAESDRIARADWESDLAAWDYDIAYEEFNAEICREDICELNMEIQSLEYQLSDVEILRNRLENLRKERDVTEKYLRNSEEFLRKYMWVKEML